MKSALVVFPDEWLAYAPTVLNLVECLRPSYEVKIVAVENRFFDPPPPLEGLALVRINRLLAKALSRARLYSPYKLLRLLLHLARSGLPVRKFDLVIGVDSVGYLAVALFQPNRVFLSLEVRRDVYLRLSRILGINNLIIQTEERKRYLLGDQEVVVTYMQNSPLVPPRSAPSSAGSERKTLVYFGYLDARRGLDECVGALELLDDTYSLHVRGYATRRYLRRIQARHEHLLASGRLTIDRRYIAQDDVVDYLSQFDIGICTYRIDKADFNYRSCPSGKLFNYYAAGLPVIGVDLPGLQSVNEFEAGVLVKELSPTSIANAVNDIDARYDDYAANSLEAAHAFDFRRAFDRFMQTLEK